MEEKFLSNWDKEKLWDYKQDKSLVTVVAIVGFKPWRGVLESQKNRQNQSHRFFINQDKEVIKQKQLAYLKEHEQDMTANREAHNTILNRRLIARTSKPKQFNRR